jgi:hypothetical protein
MLRRRARQESGEVEETHRGDGSMRMFAAAMRTGALATIVLLVGAVAEFFATVGRTWTVDAPWKRRDR